MFHAVTGSLSDTNQGNTDAPQLATWEQLTEFAARGNGPVLAVSRLCNWSEQRYRD